MLTPSPLQIDLLRWIHLIRQRHPKLLKSGFPGRRDFAPLQKLLYSSQHIEEARLLDDHPYLIFIYEIAYQLDLFQEIDGHLYVHPTHAHTFFSSPLEAQQEHILQAYLRLVLWNEMRFVETVTVQLEDAAPHPFPAQVQIQARRLLFEKLLGWLEFPLALDDILRLVREEEPDLLQLSARFASQPYASIWIADSPNKQRPALHPRDWPSIEGAFVQQMLSALAWLGLLKPRRFEHEPFRRQSLSTSSPSSPSLSSPSSSSLPALLLANSIHMAHPIISEHSADTTNSTHSTIPAQAAHSAQAAPSGASLYAPTLLVQPNLEIIVFPSPSVTRVLYQLEHFCQPTGGEQVLQYRLEKKAFFQALRNGYPYSHILRLLEEESRIPLHSTLRQQLDSWYQQSSQIVISRQGVVIETSDADEMNALLEEEFTEIPHYILDARHLFVPAHALPLLKQLSAYHQAQHHHYDQPPSRSLHIDKELHIRLDPQQADLFVETFLQKYAIVLPDQRKNLLFHITQDSLQQAQQQGFSTQELLQFLEQRAQIFPSTARLRLEALTQQIGPVYAGQVPVLFAQDERTMDRLLYEGGLGAYALRIGPQAALLDPNHQDKINQILDNLGLTFDPQVPIAWPPRLSSLLLPAQNTAATAATAATKTPPKPKQPRSP